MTFVAPCEIGSEFEEPGGKPPPRIPKSTPRDTSEQYVPAHFQQRSWGLVKSRVQIDRKWIGTNRIVFHFSIIPSRKPLLYSTIECFHMTSQWPSQNNKTAAMFGSKQILRELNSFLMQTLSFVPINLHRYWPREWKHSITSLRENSFIIPNQTFHSLSFHYPTLKNGNISTRKFPLFSPITSPLPLIVHWVTLA